MKFSNKKKGFAQLLIALTIILFFNKLYYDALSFLTICVIILIFLYASIENFIIGFKKKKDYSEENKNELEEEDEFGLTKLEQKFRSMIREEIEKREILFRMSREFRGRKQQLPFLSQIEKYKQDENKILQLVYEDRILPADALEEITDLMELYYSMKYPLR